MKRGVSLYCYQEAYYRREMTVRDCVVAARAAGAQGVEMLADQMVPGYPSVRYNLDNGFAREWHGMIAEAGVLPVAFDIYGETKLRRDRPTTSAELIEQLVALFKTGKALGFKIFRIAFHVPLDVVDALVPIAEDMDIVMASEVHAPHSLEGPWVEGTLNIAARRGTKHLGIMPDFGTYCRRIPNLVLAESRRHGVNEHAIAMAEEAYHSPGLRPSLVERIEKVDGSSAALWLAKRVEIGVWLDEDPKLLRKYLPHFVHAHAKFYEMTEDLVEPDVRYDEIMPILLRGGYSGYIMSEYEGQRLIQDVDLGYDEIEQVRRHQIMLASYINGAR